MAQRAVSKEAPAAGSSAVKPVRRPSRPRPAETLGKPVGAVVSAVKILRHLSDTAAPVGVSEVARRLKLNPSTCFNILRTLARENWVNFDPDKKVYSIGLGVMELAKGASTLGVEVNVVRPLMGRVAREYGVTVTLWRRISDARKIVVMTALSAANMRIQMSIGQRLPLLVGGAGRAMTAFSGLNRTELRKQFKEARWDRPPSFDEFMEDIEATRERGWALDKGEYLAGIASVAVPILNEAGVAPMALSGTMFISQYESERGERLAHDLTEVAQTISKLLPHL